MPSGGPGGHYEARETTHPRGLVAVYWVSDRGRPSATDRPVVILGPAAVALMRDALDAWIADHGDADEPDEPGDGGDVERRLRVVP